MNEERAIQSVKETAYHSSDTNIYLSILSSIRSQVEAIENKTNFIRSETDVSLIEQESKTLLEDELMGLLNRLTRLNISLRVIDENSIDNSR